MTKTTHPTSPFARFIYRFRWPVLLGSVVVALGIGSGAANLSFDSDYHAYFDETNPELEAFDALQATYTNDDNVLIAITPKDGQVFTKANLSALEEMTAAAWEVPFSSRVDGVTNFQYTRAEGDDLFVSDLIENAAEMSTAEIAEAKRRAVNDPILLNRLINPTASVTGLNINVNLPPGADSAQTAAMSYVREMVAGFGESYPQFDYHITGLVPMNSAFFESAIGDSMTLIPAMFVLVLLLVGFLTRSVSATIATLVVTALSINVAAGFAGLTGIKLTPASSQFPIIILTLAVADSVHILVSIIKGMRSGLDKQSAIAESLRLNMVPVAVTSITTIIGFLSFNFGDVPPYWHLGNITAVGMLAAWIFSITTLPALVHVLPLKVKPAIEEETAGGWYDKFGAWVTARPKVIALSTGAVLLAMGLLASRNVLNDEAVKFFDESIAFRTDSDYIADTLVGMYTLEYSLPAAESGGISDPEYLENLQKFEDHLYSIPEVRHVNSYAEVARRVNRSMHGDDPAYYKVPNNRDEAAQYLLLYEMSLPFGLDLNNQIDVDKAATRVTVTTDNMRGQRSIELNQEIEGWLAENTPSYMNSLGSSTTLMFANLTTRQAESITSGNLIAIVLISLILILVLRSVKLGLLSIIPNVTPVIVGFGIWYLFSGLVNNGMIIVFGLTLGVVVDDTVHFLSKYLRAKRELNMETPDAIRYAFRTVGRALVVTTLVLVAGFAVLSQSSFALNSTMAQLTAITMAAALAIDFLLLPALLMLFDGGRTTKQTVPTASVA